MTTSRALPSIALLVVAALWGGSYLAAQQLAQAIGLTPSLAARFGVAALVLLVWTAIQSRKVSTPWKSVLSKGALLGSLRSATLGLETAGVLHTTPTNAGVLIGLSVILTPLLESAYLRRKPEPRVLASAGLATIGVAMLALGSQSGFSGLGFGDMLILCAAVTRAVLVLAGNRVGADQIGALPLTSVEVSVGALVFGLFGGASLWNQLPAMTATDLTLVLYLALGCTVIAFVLQLWATARTSAAHASVLLGTEPLWALLVGIVLAGNRLTLVAGIGVAAILAATLWSQRVSRAAAPTVP
ncbi:MAG: DMT family transporter [Microbacteriaceae bacterium]